MEIAGIELVQSFLLWIKFIQATLASEIVRSYFKESCSRFEWLDARAFPPRYRVWCWCCIEKLVLIREFTAVQILLAGFDNWFVVGWFISKFDDTKNLSLQWLSSLNFLLAFLVRIGFVHLPWGEFHVFDEFFNFFGIYKLFVNSVGYYIL